MTIDSSSTNGARGGLKASRLVCAWCDAKRPADLDPWCHDCGGSLIAEIGEKTPLEANWRSFWDFAPVLPGGDLHVSLGEGGTLLLKLERLFPDDEIYVKADWMNPTGSFKDRGAALAVSAAVQLGAEGVVCASTGNNATSVSAYAARAGLPCIVTIPAATPLSKIAHSRAHGATLVEVDGNFSDAYHLAECIRTADPGWANLTSTFVNPYMTAAHATILYEIHSQLGGPVGTVIMPIGAGPMLAGVLQGAEHLQAMGEIARLPVLVGVQSSGCAPIARAFAEGSDEVVAWEENAFGMAGSINDPLRGYPEDGTRTLRAIRRTNGYAVAVADEEIGTAMRDLGRQEGIAAEPAAAAPLAGLRALLKNQDLPRPIVLVVSGHALKDPGALPGHDEPSLKVEKGFDPSEIIRAGKRRFTQI